MAYALDNPVKKITQAGDSNSIFYYTDGDATSTVVGSGYFNPVSYTHLTLPTTHYE